VSAGVFIGGLHGNPVAPVRHGGFFQSGFGRRGRLDAGYLLQELVIREIFLGLDGNRQGAE